MTEDPKKTLIVLGSGGHTTEMMRLVSSFDKNKYKPRLYLVAQTDPRSAEKALEFERPRRDSFAGDEEGDAFVEEEGDGEGATEEPPKPRRRRTISSANPSFVGPENIPKKRRESVYGCLETVDFSILLTPRAREVGQSFFTSIFSTIYVLFWCIPFLLNHKPEVILANGPGTCVPVCLVAWFLRLVKCLSCKIIFVESVCRVRTLSLSGKILWYFTDEFFVQWPELLEKYPKATHVGRLV